ncbi:MAG: lysylphosphatidylglycerol synthase domain-containing protein [Beijerinckiaceae bacterium]
MGDEEDLGSKGTGGAGGSAPFVQCDATGEGVPLKALSSKEEATRKPRHRGIGHYIGLFVSLVIASLAIFVLVRTLSHIDVGELRAAIAATSSEQIAIACGFTALSFLALTGYDSLALRQLRLRIPYPRTALASFTSYAVSFTLGFPLITAGTIRYWIYSRAGLTASKVASLTVIAGVTFWLGMALVIAVALLFRAETISLVNHFEVHINMLIGAAVLVALVAYLGWVSLDRRRTRIQGFRLELPGLTLTLGQIALGVIDLCSAAGVLYTLLPPNQALDFFTFAAVYVFACVLGIASNAPGGLGVFEAAMLKAVPVPSQEALLASLLLFRVIYYLVPFILALALLAANEGFHRWKDLHNA